MKRWITMWGLVVAATLIWLSSSLPLAQAQSNPQAGQTNKADAAKPGAKRPHKPAKPHKPIVKPGKPAKPGVKPSKPGKPPGNPHRPRPPHAGKPGKPGKPSVGKPGHRPPQVVRPRPPRPNQFYHRGNWFGRVRGPAYAYPRGWHYRHWTIGVRLPPVLFGPSYYYGGWAALGLEEPLPGYSWVRFGPDLLLVNLYTGEVEDVVYGAFY